MADSRLITVAIHTFNRATMVKNLLENEGVEVTLQNVNLTEPSVSSGVRIRIHEDDLPLALRIIENAEIFTTPTGHDFNSAPPILVPTDFTEYSERAAHIAFDIAHRIGGSITFLHAYIDPSQSGHLQLSDALTYDPLDAEERIRLEEDEKQRTSQFTNKFRQGIKQGTIPAVKFKSIVVEGVPEDTILEHAKLNNPPLIVMGT
ncbi:MAG: universal stress protein, partial [Muribaculaceae bacterium]|nr:universal stress protein [Muribaculaceae bacterium]